MDLTDKTIAITGAARGLGRATALELARRGAHLALIDRDADALAKTASIGRDQGVHIVRYEVDISEEASVEQLFKDIAEEFGALHGLVNNAGVTQDGLLVKARDGKVEKKLTLEHWQKVIDVDLTGVFLCTREAVTRMIELGSPGVIVNMSSISRVGNAGQSNYSAAKSGVAALTVVWAKELSHHGIRVAALAPGFANTALVQAMKQKARDRLADAIPLKRLAEPKELARTVVFILENEYVNGRVLEVDGGLRL